MISTISSEKYSKAMNRKYFNLVTGIALALIILMVFSSLILPHVSNPDGRICLIIGLLLSASVLAFFLLSPIILSPRVPTISKNKPATAKTDLERSKQDDNNVSHSNETVADSHSHVPEAIPSEFAENKPIIITKEPDDYAFLKELGNMIRQLDKNYVLPLEQDLLGTSNPTKEQLATFSERLLDIAFLAMDMAKISTRDFNSYEKATKSMLAGDCKKADILNQLDPSIRPTKEFKNLSLLLDEIAPGSSFFYSGYKL